MQVSLEGGISKESIKQTLGLGIKAAGDLIPWTVSRQYQDQEFGSLSGKKILNHFLFYSNLFFILFYFIIIFDFFFILILFLIIFLFFIFIFYFLF